MGLLEYIPIGEPFRDAESLFLALEKIINLPDDSSASVIIKTENVGLVSAVLLACESSKSRISIRGYYPFRPIVVEAWHAFLIKQCDVFNWTTQLKSNLSELNDPPLVSIFNQSRAKAIELTTTEQKMMERCVHSLEKKLNLEQESLRIRLEQSFEQLITNKKITFSRREKTQSIRLHLGSSEFVDFLPFFHKGFECKRMEFLVNEPKQGHRLLSDFIQVQEDGTYKVSASISYQKIKEIGLSYSNESIEVIFPDGLNVRLDSKELGIIGLWEAIEERSKQYATQLNITQKGD